MAYPEANTRSLNDIMKTVDREMKEVQMPKPRALPRSQRPLFSSDGNADLPDMSRFDHAGEQMAETVIQMYEAAAKKTEEAGAAMMQRAEGFNADCKEMAKELRARGTEVADSITTNAELCKNATANMEATREMTFPSEPDRPQPPQAPPELPQGRARQ